MESIRELYKIGRGPSSSHTIGPEKASIIFKEKYADADRYKVVLYGSLAKTGKGHGTDVVIVGTLAPTPCEIVFDIVTEDIPHPNTMDFFAYRDDKVLGKDRVFSIGGGSIQFENSDVKKPPRIYTHKSFREIYEHCRNNDMRLWEYAKAIEDDGFYEYMQRIWDTMKDSIRRGLEDSGTLPGGLDVSKKAKYLYNFQHIDESRETRETRTVCAYAFAVSEQNASTGTVVTAPTCGAAGVLPAVLYYQQKKNGYSDREIINALISAGVIGNLIKHNASISGAECGCQAEIGSACSMAAAALAELFGLSLDKLEYAAEIAMEHHLGLTCDPVCGLVQIPCIERNSVAAMRAINAVTLASILSETRKVSLDDVILAMKNTGRDLSHRYKETSEGGLAQIL